LPRAFEDCVKRKGVTVPVCYPPGKGGKPVAGEPRHSKGMK
jgi:hypothetical protein